MLRQNVKAFSTKQLGNFVNGEFVAPLGKKYLENINPATNQLESYIPDSCTKDVNRAVAVGKLVLEGEWMNYSLKDRAEVCRRISAEMKQNMDVLAKAESVDTGKTLKAATHMDITRSAENFDFFASHALGQCSNMHSMENGFNYTSRRPVGVVGLITPWNLPLYLLSWKVAPALMMGNAIVAKPSEWTPTTANLLAEMCTKAGLPNGVLNVVHGTGAAVGQALVEHPDVAAISFTGGTNTGAIVGAAAAARFKKLSLELGGKNPTIVFADCDLNDAVEGAVRSSFTNAGQVCLCGSRILVETSIRDEFQKRFVKRTKNLIVGPPSEKTTGIGSLVSATHRDHVERFVQQAANDGGTVLCGGQRKMLDPPYDKGAYFEPTVITNVQNDANIIQSEVFGPVVTIQSFDKDHEVIELANSVKYGLAASIWTKNIDRAHATAQAIDAGIVWVNAWLVRDLRTPFGGVKSSGIGREGGNYSLDFFSELKNIYIHVPKLKSPAIGVIARPFSSKASIDVASAPKPVGAYPHARRHGDLLFLSGIGPRDPITNGVPGGAIEDEFGNKNLNYDVKEQTKSVIRNIETILKGCGASLEDIVDVQVFLVDMKRDFQGFNEVYNATFKDIKATRTTCAISALPTPIAVEFKVIASAKNVKQ